MLDSSSCEERMMLLSVTGGGTHKSFSNPTKNSKSLEKEIKSYSASKTEDLRKVILEVVESQGKDARKCKILLKQKADPKVLRELLKEQKNNYDYIKEFLEELKKEITQSRELKQEEKTEIEKIIMELITDIFSKSSNNDHSSSTIQNQNNHGSGQIDNTNTPKLSSDSDSEMNLPITSEGSLSLLGSGSLTSVTNNSSEKSVNLTLNPVEEKKDPQTENKKEMRLEHLTKARPKGPSGRRSPSKYNKKIEDQMQPEQVMKEELKLNSEKSGSTLPGKEELKLEEQKKEAVLSEQSAPDNNNNDKEVLSKKQPNNRNLHVALVTGCALLAIGCIVAGAITSGLVGAGLVAIAALFATAATAELRSSFISSKLTSINVSSLIDNKKLTL